MEKTRTYRVFDLVGRKVGLVVIGVMLVVISLGLVGPMIANTDEPNFDPQGEVFDTFDRAGTVLRSESTISTATFLVEAADDGASKSHIIFLNFNNSTH